MSHMGFEPTILRSRVHGGEWPPLVVTYWITSLPLRLAFTMYTTGDQLSQLVVLYFPNSW